MSKIGKGLRALGKIIKQPSLLNLVIDSNEEWKRYVSKKYPAFAKGLPMVDFNDLFDEFTVTVEPFVFLDGGSMPTDLALLAKLASSINDCRYFEIGTWRGESVANVARFATECYTLNLSKDQMRKRGLNEKYIELHFHLSEGLKNVTQLEGDSREFDFKTLGEEFDLVFIDGDHHYEMVKNDTSKIYENFVTKDSVVVWHDYASNPENVRFEVLAGILDGLPADQHTHLYHFSNSLSAILISRPLNGYMEEAPHKPRNIFTVNIKGRRLTDN